MGLEVRGWLSAKVDEHKHNLHRVARPSKRGQAESPSRKSQVEFVKIIIRPVWARGAMEERALFPSPFFLGYCGTKAAALRIANEV